MTRFKHSFLVVLVSLVAAWAVDGADTPSAVEPEIGSVVDRYNGVEVFFNGAISHSAGRNLSADHYNIGIRYQCVEFVKRYYFQKLGHKMPDAYGHAKDFFDVRVPDGALNPSRGLLQFTNPSATKPQEEDIIVLAPTGQNPYGHIAIIAAVAEDEIEIVQQNPGPEVPSRVKYPYSKDDGRYQIQNQRVLGYLRKLN